MEMKAMRVVLLTLFALSATFAFAESDAQKAFTKLKSLEGIWEGKAPEGQPMKVIYHVISGGSAVMSQAGEDSMVTVFHLDGDRLLMTHYCGAGNQPRMVATLSQDGKTMEFKFLDATNLATPQTGHMHHALFTFADTNHHTEQWTFARDGKEETGLFSLTRRR
jgi:hypothetical protein